MRDCAGCGALREALDGVREEARRRLPLARDDRVLLGALQLRYAEPRLVLEVVRGDVDGGHLMTWRGGEAASAPPSSSGCAPPVSELASRRRSP